jgi:adenylate cyclase
MERKLTALLSADVKGYSRLMGADEAATVRTLTAYREVMAVLIQQYHGRVVDSPGDNLLAEFASAVDAVQGAVEIQQEIKARNAELPDQRKMEFRIGINVGDVIVEGDRLYGDGVNIAARLEGLAEPGGICISSTVHDQVETKLALGYEYVGEQTVKNIAKPVRVWRVRLEAERSRFEVPRSKFGRVGSASRSWAVGAVVSLMLVVGASVAVHHFARSPLSPQPSSLVTQEGALPVPDKPSIAVLPFVNLSNDPEQEYFGDGLTEDLTTDLSKLSGLFVIARNSAFTYKGKPAKVQDVGRELGVRYVLQGSVRKSDTQIRINTQLIDTTTGGHLWSERYDRPWQDIFALQDEIRQRIVFALKVKVTEEEQEKFRRFPTDNLEAYDSFLRGLEALGRVWTERRKETNAQARQMLEKAVELDPNYASAYAGLGLTYVYDFILQWDQTPQSLGRALTLAQKAVALDETLAMAHSVLGWVYLWQKQHAQALAAAQQAVALDPNSFWSYFVLGEILTFSGRPEEAISVLEQAIRHNPRTSGDLLDNLGGAYLAAERYEDALAMLQKARSYNPDLLITHVYLAVVYMWLGREEEARAEAAEVRRLSPNLSLEVTRQILPVKDPARLERYFAALRKAGLQ